MICETQTRGRTEIIPTNETNLLEKIKENVINTTIIFEENNSYQATSCHIKFKLVAQNISSIKSRDSKKELYIYNIITFIIFI